MKNTIMRVLGLMLLAAVCTGGQAQEPTMPLAGEVLHLGMDRAEALKKLSQCCKPTPLGENVVIIVPKEDASPEQFGGEVYFEGGKLSGIAADRGWSPAPASHETALTLYRLVDEITHGSSAQVMIHGRSQELSNGTDKSVVMQFGNGRRIRIEIQDHDSGRNQVIVSECVGACIDW